jgi:hypothetical protein
MEMKRNEELKKLRDALTEVLGESSKKMCTCGVIDIPHSDWCDCAKYTKNRKE